MFYRYVFVYTTSFTHRVINHGGFNESFECFDTLIGIVSGTVVMDGSTWCVIVVSLVTGSLTLLVDGCRGGIVTGCTLMGVKYVSILWHASDVLAFVRFTAALICRVVIVTHFSRWGVGSAKVLFLGWLRALWSVGSRSFFWEYRDSTLLLKLSPYHWDCLESPCRLSLRNFHVEYTTCHSDQIRSAVHISPLYLFVFSIP